MQTSRDDWTSYRPGLAWLKVFAGFTSLVAIWSFIVSLCSAAIGADAVLDIASDVLYISAALTFVSYGFVAVEQARTDL